MIRRSTLRTSLTCAFLVWTGSVAMAQTILPTRLSDAEFWALFTSLSEAGGTFASENYTSNESMVGQVASELLRRGRTGGAYIGVGPEQNFTYISALQPQIAFIVDIRRQAAIQHLMYKAIFEMSSTRAEFIEKLFSFPAAARGPYPPNATIHEIWVDHLREVPDPALAERNLEAIRSNLTVTHNFPLPSSDLEMLTKVFREFTRWGPEISYIVGSLSGTGQYRATNFATLTMIVDTNLTPRSFLASDRYFQFVKDMHARNMIIPLVGDFGGARTLRAVGSFLRERGAVVNAFYVSNVERFLITPQNKLREFYENVATLPLDSGSVFLRPGSAGSSITGGNTRFPQMSTTEAITFIQRQMRPGPGVKPPMSTCPILPFLEAWKNGRVAVFADAERCGQ